MASSAVRGRGNAVAEAACASCRCWRRGGVDRRLTRSVTRTFPRGSSRGDLNPPSLKIFERALGDVRRVYSYSVGDAPPYSRRAKPDSSAPSPLPVRRTARTRQPGQSPVSHCAIRKIAGRRAPEKEKTARRRRPETPPPLSTILRSTNAAGRANAPPQMFFHLPLSAYSCTP